MNRVVFKNQKGETFAFPHQASLKFCWYSSSSSFSNLYPKTPKKEKKPKSIRCLLCPMSVVTFNELIKQSENP